MSPQENFILSQLDSNLSSSHCPPGNSTNSLIYGAPTRKSQLVMQHIRGFRLWLKCNPRLRLHSHKIPSVHNEIRVSIEDRLSSPLLLAFMLKSSSFSIARGELEIARFNFLSTRAVFRVVCTSISFDSRERRLLFSNWTICSVTLNSELRLAGISGGAAGNILIRSRISPRFLLNEMVNWAETKTSRTLEVSRSWMKFPVTTGEGYSE